MTSPLNLDIYRGTSTDEPEPGGGATVTLEEARASFSLFGKGLSEEYLQAKPLAEAPAFLANPRRPFPFSNGRDIYLPASLRVFDSREDNWRVLRLYTAVQAEQWEAGTFDRPRPEEAEVLCGRQAWLEKKEPLAWIRFFLGRFPLPGLAGDIFLTLETARTATAMARRFPGLAADLDWFLALLKSPIEPIDYRCMLWNLFFDMLAPLGGPSQGGYPGEIMGAARVVALPEARLKDSLGATLAIYRIMEPALESSLSATERSLLDEMGGFFVDTMPGRKENKATLIGSRPQDEGVELVPPDLVEVLNLDFYSYLLPAGAGEFLTQEALGKRITEDADSGIYRRGKADGKEAAAGAAQDGGAEEERLFYPEWDHLAGRYRRGWTTLYQLRAQEVDAGASKRLLEEWDDLVREVLRQFRMLRFQERTWRKRLEWGDEIDISEAVERQVELKCGLPPSEKVYMEKRRVTREVSALFLLDLSASTSSEITEGSHRGETVLQVLTASVAIMARALEQLGDRYGIFGFSGYGRKRVEFLRIKSFDESLDDAVWGRMGGLKPMKSTRMGTAVRHAHHLLDQELSPLKLMLVLSDGYPQDFDYGDDRTDREYGLRDTARSLREAEAGHIIPFCLTVDAAGNDYLRRMCPPHGYLVLKSVEDLPSELPKVYLRLRGT